MLKLLSLLFALHPFLAHAAVTDPNVIAEINGKKLTKEDFDRMKGVIEKRFPGHRIELESESKAQKQARLDEHRQRILLTFEPGERLNVGQIVEVSPLSRSAVSHHLRILREAGVLQSEKVGKEVYFWINKDFVIDALETVAAYLREHT